MGASSYCGRGGGTRAVAETAAGNVDRFYLNPWAGLGIDGDRLEAWGAVARLGRGSAVKDRSGAVHWIFQVSALDYR